MMPLTQTVLQFETEDQEKPSPSPTVESLKRKSGSGRKKIKSDATAPKPDIPADEKLFQKQYYAIGDVAKMFHENTSLIRYWEKEFDVLKPKKNRKGDRYFHPEDVKNLQLIYHLLRDRKFTIEGAREFLKANKAAKEKFEMVQSLQKIKTFLTELKNSL